MTYPLAKSRFERHVSTLAEREIGFGHSDDARIRGRLIAEIDGEIDARTLFRDEAHQVLGLGQGSLDDGTLATERLQQALHKLRRMPNREFDLTGRHAGHGRHRFAALTVSP